MEGKAAWQPIAMNGADFNEIWDDTELIKAFSKSINYYKKMHDPNRKAEEEVPMPAEEGEECTDGRMDESEMQPTPTEAMAVSSSAPTTPAHMESTPKKTPKRKSSAARKRIEGDEEGEVAVNETATQTAAAPGTLDQGGHGAAAYAGYDYTGYGGYYPQPQYPASGGAYTAAASPAAPSPKKTQRKKKDATQEVVTPAYDPAYAAYYPPAYPQVAYGASYPYGAPSGYPMISPAYPPMPTTPHYHFHPAVPHTHTPHHHHHGHHHHHHPPPPPPPPAGLDDEELKSLLNAWYYSGYYAGRYQAMREATSK